MGSSYIAIREEDYVQSANTLFHFMKKEDYLKSILFNKAIIPRYCVENINYLGIKNETTRFEKVAVLQKCFCDIPFHKLMETFSLRGEGEAYEALSEDDKIKASTNSTHPIFYGEYAIAFSKKWGENHNLQPIHYLNENSSHTKDFTKVFEMVLGEQDINDEYVDDIINRLSFIKPLRGLMDRPFVTKEKKSTTISFWKNFHDEKEWRYVPTEEILQEAGIGRVIANPNILQLENALRDINKNLEEERYRSLWLEYEFDDIRYIIVPDAQARINIINCILAIPKERFRNSDQVELEKQVLISKILVLEEIRKDW